MLNRSIVLQFVILANLQAFIYCKQQCRQGLEFLYRYQTLGNNNSEKNGS